MTDLLKQQITVAVTVLLLAILAVVLPFQIWLPLSIGTGLSLLVLVNAFTHGTFSLKVRKDRIVLWLTLLIVTVLALIVPFQVWLAFFSGVGVFSFVGLSIFADGLERAYERARLKRKKADQGLTEVEIPPPYLAFPIRALLLGLVNIGFCYGLYQFVNLQLLNYLQSNEFLANMISAIVVPTAVVTCLTLPIAVVLAVGKLVLWSVTSSGETAFTAAEALRRRKLKKTLYGESGGDPLEMSDLRGEVSVGDDGELLDKPKREATDI
jgi:hypothetical protein